MFPEGLGGDLLTSAQHDARSDGLPPFLGGYADHSGFGHGGVCSQHIFDLSRGDVFGTAYDDIVRPTFQEQVSGIIEIAGVPRREPALSVQLTAPAEVFAGNLLTAYMYLAGFERPQGIALSIANFHLNPR
jgi:hypothetical protein